MKEPPLQTENFYRYFLLVIICSLAFIFSSTNLYSNYAHYRIEGVVTDTSNSPLKGVNVFISGRYQGTITDSTGYFNLELDNIDVDSIVIIFKYIGYQTVRKPIFLENNTLNPIRIKMIPETIFLGVVTVTEKSSSKKSVLSLRKLSDNSIKNAPMLLEVDIYRSLSLLPGTNQVNDYRSEISVRGGRADQNLLLIDGVELINQHHLFGIFNSVNPYLIEKMEFYPGYHPLSFGDKAGAIINVSTISVDSITQKMKLMFSLLSMNGIYHKRWNSFAVSMAVRKTLFEFLYPYYGFYDLFTKGSWAVSSISSLEVSYYQAQDHFRARKNINKKESEYTPYWETYPFRRWGDSFLHFRWRFYPDKYHNMLQISFAKINSSFDFQPYVKNKVEEWNAGAEWRLKRVRKTLYAGLKFVNRQYIYRWYHFINYDLQDLGIPGSGTLSDSRKTLYQRKWIAYAQLELRYYPISYGIGFRSIYYLDRIYWRPAAQFQVSLFPWWRTQLSYIRTLQYDYRSERKNEFQMESPLVPLHEPMKAENFNWNHLLNFNKRYQILLEMYYRLIHHVPSYRKPVIGAKYNNLIIYGSDISINDHEGWFTWQIGISYMRVFCNDGKIYYPADWDIPLSFKLNLGMEVKNKWYLNIAGYYRSGNVYNKAVARFISIDDQWRGIIKYNGNRFPNYSRCDIMLRKSFKAKKGYRYNIFLQVINIFASRNPIRKKSLPFDPNKDDEFDLLKSIPTIPSIGVEYVF